MHTLNYFNGIRSSAYLFVNWRLLLCVCVCVCVLQRTHLSTGTRDELIWAASLSEKLLIMSGPSSCPAVAAITNYQITCTTTLPMLNIMHQGSRIERISLLVDNYKFSCRCTYLQVVGRSEYRLSLCLSPRPSLSPPSLFPITQLCQTRLYLSPTWSSTQFVHCACSVPLTNWKGCGGILFPASAHPPSQSSSYGSFESYAASPVALSAGLWAAEWRRWSSKGRIADWDCWQAIFPRQGGEGEAPLGARCLWWWNENVLLVSFLVEKRLINNLVLIMLDFDW